MGKYDPLCECLARTHDPIEISFAEIGALVGGLPPSAYRHSAWWSNNPNGHVQAQAWITAGRRVAFVDLVGERVSFSPHAP
jgi:YD repeat-containing protein